MKQPPPLKEEELAEDGNELRKMSHRRKGGRTSEETEKDLWQDK
jgi:hypothetical protein